MNPAQFRAYTIDLATAAAFCRAHGVARPVAVERIRKGEVSASFVLTLETGAAAVLKVYCRSQDPSWLARDAASQDYLRRHSEVPVPDWGRLDCSGDIVPHPCLLMDHVGGVDADEVAVEGPEARAALLMRRCGAALAALHRTPLAQVATVLAAGLYPAERWAERTGEHFELSVRTLRQQGWVDPYLLAAAEEAWGAAQAALTEPFRPVFCHRDYQLWNLRVDPASLAVLGLLDFDAAGLGPAESDVRDLELNCFLAQPWLRRQFWLGYGRPAPEGLEAERLRLSALVRALSLLAAYWGPVAQVTAATVWALLSPWNEDADELALG